MFSRPSQPLSDLALLVLWGRLLWFLCGGGHMYQHHKESKHSFVISCRYMYLTKDFRVSTNWCLESFMLFIFLFWLALNVFLFVTFSKNDPVVFCYFCKINANIHQVIQQLQAFSKVSFLFWLLNFVLSIYPPKSHHSCLRHIFRIILLHPS